MCCAVGLAPLNSAFSAPREGTLRPVWSTRTRCSRRSSGVPPVRSDVVAWQAVQVRVQEVSKAGVTKCDGCSVNRYHSRQLGNGMRVRCERSPSHSA